MGGCSHRLCVATLAVLAVLVGPIGCGSAGLSGTSTGRSTHGGGATGQLHIVATRGPTCPVERAGAPPCVAPYQGHLRVLDALGAAVAEVDTSAAGTADLTIAAGTYTVAAATPTGGLPRLTQPVSVTVTAGATATATLSFDTGIR